MKNFTFNKQPKDPRLCKILRRAITLDRKRNGFEWEDIANELGLNGGTLENKLKPSYDNGDITLSEFMHFMEMSADYSALEYIATKFDMNLTPKAQEKPTITNINLLVDVVSMANGDVFREVKMDLVDGVIDEEEKKRILKNINLTQKALAELKENILNVSTTDIETD